MRNLLVLVFALFVFSFSDSANAMRFGHQENIHEIQEIPGTKFILSYKVSTYWFFLGYSVVDDGYVLEKSGETGYFTLTADQKAAWIEDGKLPDPMPEYSIPFLEYLLGYSLYIFLAVMICWISFDYLKESLFPGENESDTIEEPPDSLGHSESSES